MPSPLKTLIPFQHLPAKDHDCSTARNPPEALVVGLGSPHTRLSVNPNLQTSAANVYLRPLGTAEEKQRVRSNSAKRLAAMYWPTEIV